MTWLVLIALVIGAAVVVIALRRRRRIEPPAPAIEHRTVDIKDVAEYAELSATTYRVRTLRDVLPGGLSAAMAPMLVAWDRSSFANGPIMIRNLNHGGNPLTGFTVLRTAVLRPERLLRAEYVKVPLTRPHALSHGQLRFVFERGGVELLADDSTEAGEPDSFDDIILSWEAWRPPGTGYSILKGMDPGVYQLTMRAYSGAQRFLEDALQRRDWEVYTLALPGGHAGVVELLQVSLAMGDGAGRCVLSELLSGSTGSNNEWVTGGPRSESEGDAAAAWAEIESRLQNARKLGDERIDLAGRTAYQSVVRSCAIMALYQVDVATVRLIENGHAHPGGRPLKIADIDQIPEWLTELAKTNVAGLFLRGPRMIAFAHSHPGVIPGEIPKHLDQAGLLVRENGKAMKRNFTCEGDTPWGPANRLMIR